MTKDILTRLEAGPVLGDGGYLLELEKRGYVQAGPFTPEVTLTHPDALTQLHREFLLAGADVLQALTFYASEEKLATVGLAGKTDEINRQAVRIARSVAAEGDALVAGNLSLTWMYDPDDAKSQGRVRKLFDQQLAVQIEEGVDFVIGETFSYLEEALLATERIKAAGQVAMVTMSFEQESHSYEGHEAAECARRLVDAGADVVGFNCLRNPEHTLPLMRAVRAAVPGYIACQPVGYHTPEGHLDFTSMPAFPLALDPCQLPRQAMADYAIEAREIGVNYIGSCCGSVACHVRAMAEALGKPAGIQRDWRSPTGKPMSALEYYEKHA